MSVPSRVIAQYRQQLKTQSMNPEIIEPATMEHVLEPNSTSAHIDDLLRYAPALTTILDYLDAKSLKALSMVSKEWLRCTEGLVSSIYKLVIPQEPSRVQHVIQRYFTNVTIRGEANIQHLPLCVEHLTLNSVCSGFELEKYERLVSLKTVDSVFTMKTPNKSITHFETSMFKYKVSVYHPRLQLDGLTFENLVSLKMNYRFNGSIIQFVKRHPSLKTFNVRSLTHLPLRLFYALRDYTKIESLSFGLSISNVKMENKKLWIASHGCTIFPITLGVENMNPEIPQAINGMKHLTSLEVGTFDLSVLGNVDVSNLHTLKCIHFHSERNRHLMFHPSENMKTVQMISLYPEDLKSLSTRFPNLSELHLGMSRLREDRDSVCVFPSLEKLSVVHCGWNICCILAPKLKYLSVDNLNAATVRHAVSNFPDLEEFVLETGEYFIWNRYRFNAFSELLEQCKNWKLIKLDIAYKHNTFAGILALKIYCGQHDLYCRIVDKVGSFKSGTKYIVTRFGKERQFIYCLRPLRKIALKAALKRRVDGSIV